MEPAGPFLQQLNEPFSGYRPYEAPVNAASYATMAQYRIRRESGAPSQDVNMPNSGATSSSVHEEAGSTQRKRISVAVCCHIRQIWRRNDSRC
jgi:hypothetical protein